jgi:hypothetical protein
VIAVDEKPSIQALERAQGYLHLPDCKAVNGFGHCYKRHGTTTLFAALEISTGQVKAVHYRRRRRREFLEFMNDVVPAHPGREIHVVLDPDLLFLAQSGRMLVQYPEPTGTTRRKLLLPSDCAKPLMILWPPTTRKLLGSNGKGGCLPVNA